jgi:competence protein ComEA
MPMDTNAPWRALEGPETAEAARPPEKPKPAGFLVALAVAIALVAGSIATVAFAVSQQGGQVEVLSSADNVPEPSAGASKPMLVVEVAGAVTKPGVFSLPQGSRVADAIASAGGYSPDVDPRQVEATLNLAAKVQDGQVVRVPRQADAAASVGSGATSSPPGATPGLIDLNSATAEQLDTLPGIGPATAAKILAARAQQPFGSVDDLVTRKVLSAATLAKLRALVTAG